MATLLGHKTVNGAEEELPTQEDAADRRHVDALLDLSEEASLKELEPYEYHCYAGWEEAVQGWARVDPLSCILLTQKRYGKSKHKDVDNQPPLFVDPTMPNSDSSAEHRCESQVGPSNSIKKSKLLEQHTVSWSNTVVTALQKDASEWHVLGAMQKTSSKRLLEEKIQEEGMLRDTPSQNRHAKPQKHSHKPNNTVVPIKNFTFLPPIKSPQLNLQRVSGQLCNGKKAPEEETMEENCFLFNKKSGMRGTRVDPVANPELPINSAALTSKYRTCQHNLHLFSAVSVSIPKRYQVPLTSKRDTVHHTATQAHMHPSKTVYATKLYKGCEINV